MPTKDKPLKKIEKETLEEAYKRIFQANDLAPDLVRGSLAQPSEFKIVRTVTTYGAYEDPI